MKIRQVRIKNYITEKQVFREMTPNQHGKLLLKRAHNNLTLEIEVMKEREL